MLQHIQTTDGGGLSHKTLASSIWFWSNRRQYTCGTSVKWTPLLSFDCIHNFNVYTYSRWNTVFLLGLLGKLWYIVCLSQAEFRIFEPLVRVRWPPPFPALTPRGTAGSTAQCRGSPGSPVKCWNFIRLGRETIIILEVSTQNLTLIERP